LGKPKHLLSEDFYRDWHEGFSKLELHSVPQRICFAALIEHRSWRLVSIDRCGLRFFKVPLNGNCH
jgi:hypothetical protein